MSYEDIVVERVEGWVEITLNRPEKMNSLRGQTAVEIMSVLADSEEDRTVGAVILRGGPKAFCTGIDVSEFNVRPNEYFDFYRQRKRSRKVNALFRDVVAYTKPFISVVEGYALGGGLELALLGDIIVAGQDAKFGLTEVRLGMMPGGGGTQTLPRLIGPALAKELIWTGRRISAEEAKAYRLVSHVTPAGRGIDKAREITRAICVNAPVSIMLSKSMINKSLDMSLAEGIAAEGDASFLLYFSKDRDEGLAAFREKRSPKFQGE